MGRRALMQIRIGNAHGANLCMLMARRSAQRMTTTLFVVLSLLFSQLALANYVCPRQADATAMVAMMEAGMPCEGMDPQQPALCHQHAVDLAKTFEAVKLPSVWLPVVVQILELPPELDVSAANAVRWTLTPQPPPDPLFLSTLRLRV